MIDQESAWRALTSRDIRFDGVFFVGVTSTGIYCRPVCPVKLPRQENCVFFDTAETAEKAAFRPCLRCRPELAPGNAPMDSSRRIADLLIQRIDEGLVEDIGNLEEIAAQFALSSRQLRRIVHNELGVSPLELRQTRRLLLAKQLLTETQLPVTQVAYASGFASLRRFNDVFSRQYRMPPGRLRKLAPLSGSLQSRETSTLLLSYRPPFDWDALLAFLRLRAIKGVEYVDEQSYARTVRLGQFTGWVRVTRVVNRHCLQVEFSHSLTGVLPVLLRRLRHLFDLDAHPTLIATHLAQDPLLEASIKRNPGLRLPGAFDEYEMVFRAILGQQITVKAATTLSGRFAAAFGDTIETPCPPLSMLSPLATRVASATLDEVACLGVTRARARTLLSVAQAYARGELKPGAITRPEETIAHLMALPGIGKWTAQYIAMRALRWPDAFPGNDIVVRNNLGGITEKEAEQLSQAWRPWRGYAVMHIWKNVTLIKSEKG